jgi:hypothetical protein
MLLSIGRNESPKKKEKSMSQKKYVRICGDTFNRLSKATLASLWKALR